MKKIDFNIAFYVAIALAAAAGIYLVPFLVNLSSPSFSSSWQYGFNNRVAIISAWLSVCAIAAVAWWRNGTDSKLVASKPWQDMPLQVFRVCAPHILVLFSFYLLYLLIMARFIDPLNTFGEAAYLTNRILLASAGQTPYVDFEFAYGPLLLAPAILIRAGMDVTEAYFTGLAIGLFFSLLVLAYILSHLRISQLQRVTLLYTIALFSFPVTLGINYTLIRYIVPIAGLLLLNDCLDRQLPNTLKASIHYHLIALVTLLVTLSLSPEVALVYMVVLIVLGWHASRGLSRLWSVAAYLLLPLTLAFIAHSLGVSVTLLGFAAGGGNLPIVANPYTILYFSLLFLACHTAVLRFKFAQDRRFASIVLLGVGLLPGALGRADAGHIVFYGLPIILCGIVASSMQGRWIGRIVLSVVVLVLLSSTVIGEYLSRGEFKNLLNVRLDDVLQERREQLSQQRSRLEKMGPVTLITLFPGQSYSLFYSLPNVSGGYFYGLLNLYTPSQVEIKLDEIESSSQIVLPSAFMFVVRNPHLLKYVQPLDREFLALLLQTRYQFEQKNYPAIDVWKPIFETIGREFVFVTQIGEYTVLKRR